MSKQLLPLCSVGKIAIRDGLTGQYARLTLPAYPYIWFASGAIYDFPSATVAQDPSITLLGTTKPNTFVKEAGVCFQT